MSADILFDNIVITDDEAQADFWAQQTYDLKRKHLDKQAVSGAEGLPHKYFKFLILK